MEMETLSRSRFCNKPKGGVALICFKCRHPGHLTQNCTAVIEHLQMVVDGRTIGIAESDGVKQRGEQKAQHPKSHKARPGNEVQQLN